MKMLVADRLQSVQEYFFSRKMKEIDRMNQRNLNVINLGIGNPDLAPDVSVIDELVKNAYFPETHGYQNYKGLPELRLALSNWYKITYGVDLNSDEEVLPLMGSKEGILHISMTYLNTGDEVLIPNPGYPTYESATKLSGAIPVFFNLTEHNNWFPNIQELESLVSNRTKIMWINYPNMPTGKSISLEQLQLLVEFTAKHNILLINDNPYSTILNNKFISILNVKNSINNCLELNSLSKTFNMAGWRVGFVVGKKDRINEILRFKSNMDSGMFLPIQRAAIKALTLPLDYYSKNNTLYKVRQNLVFQLLDLMGCSYDKNQKGMFVWAKIPDYASDSTTFSDTILNNAQVFLTPGAIFGSNGNRYIRISLCSDEKNIEIAINRINEYLNY